MAAFGTGLGADPRAAARAAQLAEASKVRQRNIRSIGEGQNAFNKGVGALGVVAGEHLGSALAGAFGMEQPVSPELEAANKQAALLEQINLLEGDPASADYAARAAKIAMDAGDQATAYQFAQESGKRAQAEKALGIKTEAAELKVDAENFGRQGASTKLDLIANNDPRVRKMLGYEEGPEWDKMIAGAKEQKESNIVRNKAKVAALHDPTITPTNIKATRAWMPSANISFAKGMFGKEEELEAGQDAVAAQIGAKAKELIVTARANKVTLSNADANAQATDFLIDNGTFIVEVGTGTSWGGLKGAPEGHRTITGFGTPTAPEAAALSPEDAAAAEWAAANPNDPRAIAINQRLGR
jgi:hypothetical protein